MADGSARVDVRPCGVNLCGIVSWSKSNEGIGTEVLRGMKPVGEHRWEGPVFDPRSGKTYQSAVILTGDRLRVEGCLMGFLCGGETWTRAG